MEINFGKKVQELAVEASGKLPEVSSTNPETKNEEEHILALSEISPRSAIIKAWLKLEIAAVKQ